MTTALTIFGLIAAPVAIYMAIKFVPTAQALIKIIDKVANKNAIN